MNTETQKPAPKKFKPTGELHKFGCVFSSGRVWLVTSIPQPRAQNAFTIYSIGTVDENQLSEWLETVRAQLSELAGRKISVELDGPENLAATNSAQERIAAAAEKQKAQI